MTWTEQELDAIDAAAELRIATPRADGTLRRAVPIWAVRVGEQVYVRTWHRRDTGWFGHAVRTGRARIDVPGVAVDVAVDDVGDAPELREPIAAAYRTKYGHGDASVERMVDDDAAAATLRLTARREPH